MGAPDSLYQSVDESVAEWAAGLGEPWIGLSRRLTHLGGTEVVVSVAALASIASMVRDRSVLPTARLIMVIGGQNLTYNIAKKIARRRRPPGPHHAFFRGESFPSGHTATAASAWPLIAEVMAPHLPRWPVYFLGPAVGATRVVLGVHWFTDVAAGLGVGWSWLGLGRVLDRNRSDGASYATQPD